MIDTQPRLAQPIRGDIVSRYFLDRSGVPTQRMANLPGKGHFDIAQKYLGTDLNDLYTRMANLGFARVMETDAEIHVESSSLTPRQKRYLNDRSLEFDRPVILNSRDFIESKDPRAKQIVTKLLE